MKNYYQILGLEPNCNSEQIKSAFKEYAMHYHPDKHQGNSFFSDKFIEIKEAYDCLNDYQARKAHDDFHNFNQTNQSSSNSNSQQYHTQSQQSTTTQSHQKSDRSQNSISEENYWHWAFERVEGNDYYGAIEELEKGFDKFPKSSLLMYCEGKIQEAFGYYIIARKCYKKAFDAGLIEAKTDIIRIENLFTNAIGVAKKHYMNGMFFCIVGIMITVVLNTFDNLFMGMAIGVIINMIGSVLLIRRMFNELPKSLVESLGRYSFEINLYGLLAIGSAVASPGLTAYFIY